MFKNLRTQNDGFTLIEVILSIAILSIVSVIVLRLFVVSHDLNESSRTSDHASTISVNVIETIKGYRNLDNYLTDHPWMDSSSTGYKGSIVFDESVTVDTLEGYILTCEMVQDKEYDTLYNLSVSVTTPDYSETIISYKASHFFAWEVTEQ